MERNARISAFFFCCFAFTICCLGCQKYSGQKIQIKDEDFERRLNDYFFGSSGASSLFVSDSSALSHEFLAKFKRELLRSGIADTYMIEGANPHLLRNLAPPNTTLIYERSVGSFFSPSRKADGLLVFEAVGGGSLMLSYCIVNEERYLVDFEVKELPESAYPPVDSVIQYNLEVVDRELLLAPGEELVAEIRMEYDVDGVSYIHSEGIFFNSGIIRGSAGGQLQRMTIVCYTELNGCEIEVFQGEDKKVVFDKDIENAKKTGESYVLDLYSSGK